MVEVTGAASECNDPIIRSTAIWSTRINGREGSLDSGEWEDGQHPGPGFSLAGHYSCTRPDVWWRHSNTSVMDASAMLL